MAVESTKVPKTGETQKVEINTRQGSANSSQWWNAELEKRHLAVIERIGDIRKEQQYKREQILRWFRLYDGRNPFGFEFNRFTPPRPVRLAEDRITMNVIQAVVDTVTSKIAKNKPHPVFLTEDGRFDQKLRAERLTRFVRGVFYANDAYKQGTQLFRTAGAIGTGTWKIYADGAQPKIEYVYPGEVIVDDEEAFYGNPRNRYQAKTIAKEVLIASFPDKADLISNAEAVRAVRTTKAGEYVEVIEAWHLPSGKGSGDGLRVMVIDGVDLLSEEWKRDYFPFEDFHWSDPLIGFWGRGLSEELEGIQIEINRLLIKIQLSHRMFAFPMLLSPKGANLSEKKLSNAIGQVWEYVGNKEPKIASQQTVHQEIYQHLDRLYRRAFEIAGVSLLTATSQKPAGLESGVALREFSDIETERFMTVGQSYEELYMRTARHIIDVMDEIEAAMGAGDIPRESLTSQDPIHRELNNIDWKDAKMDQADYTTQVLPVSSLRSSPAGRLEDVMDRINFGIITKEVGLKLLDMPDISAEDNVVLAQLKDIEWTIAEILEGRTVDPPDAFQNLTLGIERMRAAYLTAKRNKAPEKIMDALRNWIGVASAALAAAAQPPAPPPGLEAAGGQSPVETGAAAGPVEPGLDAGGPEAGATPN